MKDLVKLFSKNFFVLLTIGAGIHSGHSFAQEVMPAAAASFPLSLTGTVIGADGKNKAVVMDETDKKQYLLKVGDTVRDIVVQQVERGKVVLLKDGKKTTLRLKNRKGEGKASLPTPTLSENTALPSPPPPPALEVPTTAAPAMDESPATAAPAMDEAPALATPPPPPAPAPAPPVQ